MTSPEESRRPIPVGVSSCLLGNGVRFDGGHKRDSFLVDTLAPFVEWVVVCPEIEVGLGTPRESCRLVRTDDGIRLVMSRSGRDLTEAMSSLCRDRAEGLRTEHLRGFVLKKASPTCGLERVRVYSASGDTCLREGRGLWASALVDAHPNLPVEEEGRLQDPRLRENFVTRVFAYDRWLVLRERGVRPRDLVAFHTAHKMLLLAHSPQHYRVLGRLVARAGGLSEDEWNALLTEYEDGLMGGLSKLSTPGKHHNVLEHLVGYLQDDLSAADREEVHRTLTEYRSGWVPLITPLVLLRSYLKRLDHAWIEAQLYFDPYPRSLGLRSEI